MKSSIPSTSKFLWQLSLKLELITYLQGVPIGVVFIVMAAGFQGDKLIAFVIGVLVAVTTTLLVPAIRWQLLKHIIAPPIKVGGQGETIGQEILKRKIALLNFPQWQPLIVTIQWALGINIAYWTTNSIISLSRVETLPYVILWFMIIGINACSHFFVSEIELSSLLSRQEMRDVELAANDYRKISLRQRFIFTLASITILPVIFLSYFILALKSSYSEVYPIEYGLAIAACLLSFMIYTTSNLFLNSLRKNSRTIADIALAMASGKIQDQMPLISTDELGQVSQSVNTFLSKINSVISGIQSEARTLRGRSETLATNTTLFYANAQDQAAAYEEMAAAVEELAASGSSVLLQANNQDEQVKIANTAVEELSTAILEIHRESDLAKVEAGRTATEAVSGSESIERSVRTMVKIQSSTDKMTSALVIILAIADKIKLLSINAAIEAARAGESGKGFSVVANEISKLGDSTNSNAVKIRSLIEDAIGSVKEGAGDMADSAESFAKIEESIKRSIPMVERISSLSVRQLTANDALKENFEIINRLAADIRNSTAEQSLTLTEFSESVMRLQEGTQSVLSNSENVNILASELAGQALTLNREVDYFRQ